MKSFPAFTPELNSIWDQTLSQMHQPPPFSDFAWHQVWSQTLGRDDLLLILVDDRGTILPLTIKDTQAEFTGGVEVADYLDLISLPQYIPVFLPQALKHLQNQGISTLTLVNLPLDSPTLKFFRTDPAWTPRATIAKEDTTPSLDLPNSWEDYLMSLRQKYRKEINRKLNRFSEAHPQIKFIADTKPFLNTNTLFSLMENREDKRTFLTPTMRRFFTKLLKRPDAATVRLVQGTTTIAFKLFFSAHHTVYLYNSGYNPAFDSAGFILVAQHIQHAINSGFKVYNFLQGSERYKYDFGAKDFLVHRLTVNLN